MINKRMFYVIISFLISALYYFLFGANILVTAPIFMGILLYSSMTMINIKTKKIKKYYGLIIGPLTAFFSIYFFAQQNHKEIIFIEWIGATSVASLLYLIYISYSEQNVQESR